MGNQIEIRESVNKRATTYGIGGLEQQRINIQNQLIEIEEYFLKIITEQNQVQKQIKKLTKLNIYSVSEDTNIPHATIYNNSNTLKVYIEKRIEEIQKEDILGITKAKQSKRKNEDFSDMLADFRKRFIDQYELELQITKLEEELQTRTQQVEQLIREKFELEQENKTLRRQPNSSIENVIPIRS